MEKLAGLPGWLERRAVYSRDLVTGKEQPHGGGLDGGPGAEPGGNDLTPFETIDPVNLIGDGVGPGGVPGGGTWGCLLSMS